MGSYSTLNIGKHERSWKYDIPAFLSFLFDETEKYKKYSGRGEDKHLAKIGYKTTCGKALKRLDELGLGWDMVFYVYSFFYQELWDAYQEALDDHLYGSNPEMSAKKLEQSRQRFLGSFRGLTRADEARDFANFYGPLLDVCSAGRTREVTSINGKTYTIKGGGRPDREPDLEMLIYHNEWSLPPWIVMISRLFEWETMAEYTEVLSVLDVKFLLEAQPAASVVKVDLAEMVEDEAELQYFHEESSMRLIKKLDLYNTFFFSIAQKEKVVRDLFAKEQFSKSIAVVETPNASNYDKGKELEKLIDTVFSSVDGLKVVDRRLNTGDEEIDIQVKNNLAKPFWTAFASPFILVECKNWSRKVGASDIRDFEGKLRNHSNVTKIGIFIAYNGFTSEATTHIQRMSRGTQHLVFVTGDDLRRLTDRETDVLEWLEDLFSALH